MPDRDAVQQQSRPGGGDALAWLEFRRVAAEDIGVCVAQLVAELVELVGEDTQHVAARVSTPAGCLSQSVGTSFIRN